MPAITEIASADLFPALGISLALGLLVGIEREWANDRVAGIRTFGLVTLSGALSALVAGSFGGLVIAGALVCLTVMIVIGNVASLRAKEGSGLTTEFAIVVMFFTGMLPMLGHKVVAIVVAGAVLVLLQWKKSLHEVVHRIGEDELRAIARLVLIGLVILPVLPNKD